MNDQPDLFDFARERAPAQVHSATSMAAAEEIDVAMPAQRARVWAFFEGRSEGATDEQAQDELQMNPSAQRPRRIELCDLGMLADSGRTELTRSGRLATVWEPVPEEKRQAMREHAQAHREVDGAINRVLAGLTLTQKQRALAALRGIFT